MTYSEKYWTERIDKKVPEKIKRAIKRVYEAYSPGGMLQGICDPMYIMNVIAYEVGFGDGK